MEKTENKELMAMETEPNYGGVDIDPEAAFVMGEAHHAKALDVAATDALIQAGLQAGNHVFGSLAGAVDQKKTMVLDSGLVFGVSYRVPKRPGYRLAVTHSEDGLYNVALYWVRYSRASKCETTALVDFIHNVEPRNLGNAVGVCVVVHAIIRRSKFMQSGKKYNPIT